MLSVKQFFLMNRIAFLVLQTFLASSILFASTPTGISELSQFPKNSLLEEIDHLVNKGDLLNAKNKCESLIDSGLPAAEKKLAERALQDINIKILFSPTVTPNSFFYTVKSGDTLSKIAKKNDTTVELIKKSNQLKNNTIYEGMKLKIMKTTFKIVVDISDHVLHLYADDKLIKTYSVATGRMGRSTPQGTFTIENKLENPVWYHEGAAIPSGDPENILGSRWMGFSLKSYGIHGTTLPKTVGTAASEGCIRMLNHEVEELYTIVPQGTAVTLME